MIIAYVLFSLPWDEWGLFSGNRPARRAGVVRQGYAPFLTTALDGQRALTEATNFVALGPRVSGADGARKAAEYLASQLQKAGIDPVTDEFCVTNSTRETTFRNVLGTIEGSDDRLVVLASHYDTKSGIADDFVGANDSGSSCGLLLELARVLRNPPGPHPGILLAFLDGEECFAHYSDRDGLQGSRRLAQKLKSDGNATNVLGVIVLDMVGDRDLSITIPNNSRPELVSTVFAAAREEGVRLKFTLLDSTLTDDHDPFLQERIPAVDLVDFHYGSAPGKNDYWHTPEDTVEKLSAESLGIVGRVTLRTVNKLMEKASEADRASAK
jgi:glutaminyl-peptide cyclotransferase